MRAAIFDLDGTLIDSMPVWKDCDIAVLASQGLTASEEIHTKVKTMSVIEAAEYFMEEVGMKGTPEEIEEQIWSEVRHQYHELVPAKKSVETYIKQLHKQGVRLCVATATDKELASVALKRLGIYDFFEFIVTCEEVGIGKDSPLVYHTARERLAVPQEEIVIFEDALHGIQTAKKAGYRVCGVHDLSADDDETTEQVKQISDYYVQSFCELLYK